MEDKSKKKMNPVIKAIRDVIAGLLWLLIIVKVFIIDFDLLIFEAYAPTMRWFLHYRFFGLLAIISILLLGLAIKKYRQFTLYIIFYPIIILFWKIPKLFFQNWAIVIAFLPAIYEIIKSFHIRFLLMTIAILSAVTISLTQNKIALYAAMIFLFYFLIVKLFSSFKRAYRSSMFSNLTGLVRKFRAPFGKGSEIVLWKKVELDSNTDQKVKEYDQQVTTFYFLNWAVEFAAEKVRHVARSRKPDLYFIAAWLVTVMITALVYAFGYWALYKINPGNFSANHILTGWSFIGFSMGKLMPSSISSINPIGAFSTILCYTELFCALIILVILVFSILTAAREKYKEDVDEFISELTLLGSDMQNHFCTLFCLAISDIENLMISKNCAMVNMLRKTRGLPELPLPIPNPNQTRET